MKLQCSAVLVFASVSVTLSVASPSRLPVPTLRLPGYRVGQDDDDDPKNRVSYDNQHWPLFLKLWTEPYTFHVSDIKLAIPVLPRLVHVKVSSQSLQFFKQFPLIYLQAHLSTQPLDIPCQNVGSHLIRVQHNCNLCVPTMLVSFPTWKRSEIQKKTLTAFVKAVDWRDLNQCC